MEEKILTSVPKTMEIVKPPMKGLSSDQVRSLIDNLIRFTAPFAAVFFTQLALGVEFKKAGLVALVTFYAALADFFKKYNSVTPYLREK